jgi:hypothetical protein
MNEDPEVGMSVRLTDRDIVITLPVLTLEFAVPYALDSAEERWKVTDAQAFARDVVRELHNEQEDGTTIVAEMFDEVFRRALEQGGEGVDFNMPEPEPPRGEHWTHKSRT